MIGACTIWFSVTHWFKNNIPRNARLLLVVQASNARLTFESSCERSSFNSNLVKVAFDFKYSTIALRDGGEQSGYASLRSSTNSGLSAWEKDRFPSMMIRRTFSFRRSVVMTSRRWILFQPMKSYIKSFCPGTMGSSPACARKYARCLWQLSKCLCRFEVLLLASRLGCRQDVLQCLQRTCAVPSFGSTASINSGQHVACFFVSNANLNPWITSYD